MHIAIIALTFLAVTTNGSQYLSEITPYQQTSYYKEQVYAEHTVQSFFALKEVNGAINPANYDIHLLNAALFFATNKLRAEKKLPALTHAPALRDAATIHSWQMVTRNFFSHYNSRNRKLYTPQDRFNLFNVRAEVSGENCDLSNIPVNGKTTYAALAQTIVKNFYDSPDHRKIMLDKKFTRLGCGVVFEEKPKKDFWYCKATQDFTSNF